MSMSVCPQIRFHPDPCNILFHLACQNGHMANLTAVIADDNIHNSYSRALLPPSSTFPPYLIASCVETRCHWPAHRISTSVSESATEIRSSACHSHLELPCEERRTEEPQTTHIMGRRRILAAGQMAMPSPSPSAMANPRGPLIPRPKSKRDLLNSSYALLASTPHCKRNNPICLLSEAI